MTKMMGFFPSYLLGTFCNESESALVGTKEFVCFVPGSSWFSVNINEKVNLPELKKKLLWAIKKQ